MNVVQVGGRHLRGFFFIKKNPDAPLYITKKIVL